MKLLITEHFKDRVDDRLENYEELAELTYTQLAEPILHATEIRTTYSGDTYIVATLKGVTYGIGYTITTDTLVVKTILSPYMVEKNKLD